MSDARPGQRETMTRLLRIGVPTVVYIKHFDNFSAFYNIQSRQELSSTVR
jgi:hypothetical protein